MENGPAYEQFTAFETQTAKHSAAVLWRREGIAEWLGSL